MGLTSICIVMEAVGADEMDQEECVSRGGAARREPQSTNTLRGWTQKEGSAGKTQNIPERRRKTLSFGSSERKMRQTGGMVSTEWSVAEKWVEVRMGMFLTHVATMRQLLTLVRFVSME